MTAVPLMVTTKSSSLSVNMVPSDTEEDNTEDEASTAVNAQPAQEAPPVAKTPSPVSQDLPADNEAQSEVLTGDVL